MDHVQQCRLDAIAVRRNAAESLRKRALDVILDNPYLAQAYCREATALDRMADLAEVAPTWG